MRILMTKSDPRAGARAQAILEDAGHEVLHCTDATGRPFPCRGVAGESCPLDDGAVVAVSAPASVPPEPAAGDVGLICALRHQLPVVVVSAGPDASWPGAPLGPVDAPDLPAAVERAASADLPRHTEAVLADARQLVGDAVSASVTRVGTGLEVVIDLPEGVDDQVAQQVAVRAQGSVRRIDRWAPIIDVRIRVV